jgi:DNA-binding SARP family transcriptional activator
MLAATHDPPHIELKVLGPVVARPSGVATMPPLLTQSVPLALLCYLVLARPRGLHARATLQQLIWSERTDNQARRGLRNALYHLRESLGDDMVLSVGEQLVGIDARRVRCDAIDLERDQLDLEGVDLRAGPVLGGLDLPASPRFAHWLDGERRRLEGLLRSPRQLRAAPVERHAPTLHESGPYSNYLRGHYLFLRAAHSGDREHLAQARKAFERALELDPGYAPALAGLANYFAVTARRGPFAEFRTTFDIALQYARRAAALDHRLAIPHVHLAVAAQYLDDDWDRAGVEFGTAVAKEPDYAEGLRFYGVWLGQVGRHEQALAHMERAAQLEPDIAHIQSSLGAARLATGDLRGAEAALRDTLRLDERHRPARERLVALYEREERFAEAAAERARLPDRVSAARFAEALKCDGPAGYRKCLREQWLEEARAIEDGLLEGRERTVDDIFAPPEARLVALLLRLGKIRRAQAWQLQACAQRPALARWFAALPERRAG